DSGAYRQNPEAYAPLTGHRYNMDPYIEYFTPSGDRHTLRMRLYSVGNATVDIAKSSFAKLYYSEYRFLKKLGGETNWTSGMAYSRNTGLANLYEDHRGSNMAFYSQLDAKLPARVKVSTGVRWEINALNGEFYYSLPVFRAGVNFQATRSTFMRSSFGQGYRFPSVAEKFADADVAGLHIFRNPGLEPERGWSAEAAVKQGFGSGSWAGFMDMAFFWTEYENMIEYLFGAYPEDPDATPTFDDIGFKALNIGTARITGFEFSLNTEGELGPLGIRSTGGYTFMNPVDPSVLRDSTVTREGAHFLKYRRQHLVKVDLELNFGEVFFGVNYQFNSRMVNVDSVFIDPLIGNLLQPGFPDYWKDHSTGYSLVDFRLGWNITGWIRINAILRNALNVEYLGRPGDIGPPRSIIFQTRLEF
ncbi:MAG: TonB-dependent receptor, partial [Bacteroidetes bacterium]